MDDFFTKTRCDRCGRSLANKVRIMSIFNTDCLCPECKEEETLHPEYETARKAEAAAVASGDRNFAGIGYPG